MTGIVLNSHTPDISTLSITSLKSGYNNLQFIGKETQFEQVLDLLDKQGFIPENLIEDEANWFYHSLGIDDIYFERESVEGIVSHIHALYSAKIDAFARNDLNSPLIHHKRESNDHAVYFDTSVPGSNEFKLINYEQRIDDLYLDQSESSYRVESFNAPLLLNNDQFSTGGAQSSQYVRAHFVYENKFTENSIYDQTFLKIVSAKTKSIYDEVIEQALVATGPVIKHLPVEGSDEHRVIVGYKKGSTKKFFSALSALINYYKLDQSRKYVENFSNGVTIISIYLKNSVETNPLSIYQLIKEVSLLYTIPHGFFQESFSSSQLSLQESIYAHIGVIFVTHFLNRLGPEYQSLLQLFSTSKDSASLELLNSLRKRLRSETFTQSYILDVFNKYKPIISQLYRSFADVHYIKSNLEKTLSYQRLSLIQPIRSEEEFNLLLLKNVFNENDALVLRALFNFNKAILKTNFFVSTKNAISFRLNPDFLPKFEYPETPFGLFFIVGAEFRGFHIRFRDIARGGIRIVRSRSQDAYDINVRDLFDENYNLASTQQRKNKDIPEGGSKGVILLDSDAQDSATAGFEKYVDALIDLLIPNSKEPIVDLYGKTEILFLGPDEGTAGYTEWATLHAKKRGASWWKSFLTGKPPQLGGIPHDEYGMTSLSVRSYVHQIYHSFNLQNTRVTKFQTGGPDGDLGSNEILLSTDNEVYVAIVDGSGVIVDAEGLDKDELKKLAHARVTINNYDKSKLSSKGFIITVDDKEFKIPSTGEIIPNGTYFRNAFHLNVSKYVGNVDLFVPCGGRPAAIDIDTVHSILPANQAPVFKYIVEGANLFITQNAKLQLEAAGVVVFKDASTNKGGVTSSSLEVLVSLVLNDEQFLKDFNQGSQFYADYVKEVQKIIVRNAEKEAAALLKLKEKTGSSLSESSDLLSNEINKLADLIASSDDLWNDITLRNKVIGKAIPPLLIRKATGGDVSKIIEHLPENYARSLFATTLSTGFIYNGSLDFGNVIELLQYLKKADQE